MDFKKDHLLSNAILFNLIHLAFALGFDYLFRLFPTHPVIVGSAALVVECVIWFLAGFRFVLFANTRSVGKIFLFIVVLMLPMVCLLGVLFYLTNVAMLSQTQSWTAIFFASSPVLLWHRMGMILGYVFKPSIYYVILAHMALLFLVTLLGALFARPSKKQQRRRRQRVYSDTQMLSQTMVLTKQDMGPRQHFPVSDDKTRRFSREELREQMLRDEEGR